MSRKEEYKEKKILYFGAVLSILSFSCKRPFAK